MFFDFQRGVFTATTESFPPAALAVKRYSVGDCSSVRSRVNASRKSVLCLRIIMGGLFVLALGTTANAQFKASIPGTIKDTAAGLVPEAKITLTNTETGKTQEATSSGEGFYRLSG